MGKGASQGAVAAAWQSPRLAPPLQNAPQSHPDTHLLEVKAAETCCLEQLLCSPSAEPRGWTGPPSAAVPFLLRSGFCYAHKQKEKITWRELKAN